MLSKSLWMLGSRYGIVSSNFLFWILMGPAVSSAAIGFLTGKRGWLAGLLIGVWTVLSSILAMFTVFASWNMSNPWLIMFYLACIVGLLLAATLAGWFGDWMRMKYQDSV